VGVAREKMKLFKESVILLGFIVTRGETRTNPEKVRPIKEFPEPKNLFSLSSSSIWQAITETSSKISPQLLGPLQGVRVGVAFFLDQSIGIDVANTFQLKIFI